jgi:arginine repressor
MKYVFTRPFAGLLVAVALGPVSISGTVQSAPSPSAKATKPTHSPIVHALEGTVEAVDSAAKTVSVKTADGTVTVVKVTERTTVAGVKAGAKYTDLAAEKGAHVVVTYTEEGSEKTADGISDFGKGTKKAVDGTVVDVDKAGKTVTVKTAEGSEQVFSVSERASVETAKGVAKGTTKGAKVTVYYTEEGGKKVAHFFKHL